MPLPPMSGEFLWQIRVCRLTAVYWTGCWTMCWPKGGTSADCPSIKGGRYWSVICCCRGGNTGNYMDAVFSGRWCDRYLVFYSIVPLNWSKLLLTRIHRIIGIWSICSSGRYSSSCSIFSCGGLFAGRRSRRTTTWKCGVSPAFWNALMKSGTQIENNKGAV